jgi:hypothetical protein
MAYRRQEVRKTGAGKLKICVGKTAVYSVVHETQLNGDMRKEWKGTKENKKKYARKQVEAEKKYDSSSAVLCESRETGRKRDGSDE